MSRRQALMVHATNVTGLGASQVVRSIIASLEKADIGRSIDCYLPTVGPSVDIHSENPRLTFRPFRRRLPNSVSRLLECTCSGLYFEPYRYGITLGDIPLRNIEQQVVLAHQPHLTSPAVNGLSDRHLNARMMRWLFRRNLRFVKHLVVQTQVMADELEASYPEIASRLVVVPQPPPVWFVKDPPRRATLETDALTLFYPAAGYPHKNHRLLARMAAADTSRPSHFGRLIVTLRPEEARQVAMDPPWLENVGRLDPEECLQTYRQAHALFFPSTAESYGLPLVEAMVMGLPVVCSDLPFARWLCEDQAIYFDPQDPVDAWRAVKELGERLASSWSPDWRVPLAKLPRSWDDVGRVFLDLLEMRSSS